MTALPTAPFSVAGARITGADGVRSFVPVGANIGVNNRVGGTQYPFDEARNPHVVEAAAWGWNTVRLTVSVSEEVSWVNSYGAENAHADIYAAADNYVDAGFVVVLALMDVTAGNQPRTDGKDADMFAFLSEAATRYVGEPRVWFNVNEPAGVATAEAFQAFHGRMYSAVRNVGNQSIYVADVMTNAQDGTWRTAPIAHDPTVGPAFLQGRTNVVFGLHNYGGQAQNTFTQGMVDAKYLAYIDDCQAAGMCVQIFEAGYRVDGLDQAGGTADVNRNVRGFRASLNLPKDRRVGVVVWNGTFDLFGLKNTLKSTYHTQPFWFEGPDGDLSPMGQEFWQYSHLPPLEEHVAQNVNVVQGGLASGTGSTVNLAAPARKAGDIVQFVSQSQYPATPQTTTGYTKVIEQGGFTVWQQDTTVDTAAGNARLNFAGSGTYSAFFQVINATAVVNPNPPASATLTATAVAGVNKVTVSWTVDPASAFTDFAAGRDGQDVNGAGPWTSAPLGSAARSQEFTNLVSGTEYTFTVTGTTATGAKVTTVKATPTGATVPVDPPPAAGTTAARLAAITLPARGWFSGASGHAVDNNNTAFGTWRGDPVDASANWLDNPTNGGTWGWGVLGSTNDGPVANFKGYIDVRPGGFTSYVNPGNGSQDAAVRSMLQRLRVNRTIQGVLYPTSLSFAHEMNGTWYDHKVTAAQAADWRKFMARVISIRNDVYPELLIALSPNGERTQNVNLADLYVPGTDILVPSRYNQNPYIGTNRAGGFTSWEDGIMRGTDDEPIGIERHRRFALARGMAVGLAEYGNNSYESNTSNNSNCGDDPYWISRMLPYIQANAGKTAGKFLFDVWFNQIGKEDEKWPVYRTDGVALRGPNVSAAYRSFFQNL